MSITVFLAFCILGCDFMLYVLFQWLYGDKRRVLARKLAALKSDIKVQKPQPRLISSVQGAIGTERLPQAVKQSAAKRDSTGPAILRPYNEPFAYRRITAAFAQSRFRG
jgi:hypothetical protein